MTTALPIGDTSRLEFWLGSIHTTLRAAFCPVDDEENERYFDGASEYTNRDTDEEDTDDADDYLSDEDDTEEDDDDLG